ncbi:hypothetical protein GVY41_03030 [Frigidibacter albus]|uniref:Uncharacterized protein n=1 Tax=Frigidibacter albus TaxID=1465486 RepID=A0A6L8VDF7_9RHOB|nr:hypothetical protein [Frigidibacter albus]MZQ88348.1 hypothetical protein [Frigidibacter albus]NBE29978.1 hypothetical protein [Frigidibacter albus]
MSEFEDLIEQFDEAFRSRPRASYHHGRPYDDFATFQIDGARVVLAYCDQPTEGFGEGFGSGHQAGLVLAVSFGVNEGQPVVLAERREALCRSISAKIAARYPADLTLWSETGGEFGPDEFDGIVRDICRVQMEVAEAFAEAVAEAAPEVVPEAAPVPMRQPIAARLAKARAKISLRPTAPEAFANSQPDLPHPMVSEAARIREALYEAEARENSGKAPLVQRLTLYSMNLTLIIVVAPVGAALLTYNALGREDLKLTARALSLTGIAVACAQTPLGMSLMQMI